MRTHTSLLISAMLVCFFSFLSVAYANEQTIEFTHKNGLHAHNHSSSNTHAPIGVMGDHMHEKGSFMLSYRFMHMDMNGNRQGRDKIAPLTIATTQPNRFFGLSGQPPTLRIVPTAMSMDMHMIGGMFAPTDWLTLMVMGQYLEKDMKHTTFAGGAGTNTLGTFSTRASGWGDTKLTGLVRLFEKGKHHVHLNAGLSLPTGSITQTAAILTPTGATPRLRMPYAMQLGTGTYDLLPGITYTAHKNAWSWGAQYAGELRLENRNSQGYAWGDKHALSAWGSYEWAPWISTSARLSGSTQEGIDGIDSNIIGPVQTADPNNYGGETLDLGLGLNLMSTQGILKDHRVAFEMTAPVYRDLNGIQLERDWTFMLGWQKAF